MPRRLILFISLAWLVPSLHAAPPDSTTSRLLIKNARIVDDVQPGDRANLVVLNASPLEYIRHIQQISRVIHRGRVVERAPLIEDVNALRGASP